MTERDMEKYYEHAMDFAECEECELTYNIGDIVESDSGTYCKTCYDYAIARKY